MGDSILDMMKAAGGDPAKGNKKPLSEYRVIEANKVPCVACGMMADKEETVRRGMCYKCIKQYDDTIAAKNPLSGHPTSIPGWGGTLEELADSIENLRYDKSSEFIYCLSMAFRRRANADRKAGRTWLATKLSQVSSELGGAHFYANRAWEICKSHMKTDTKDG